MFLTNEKLGDRSRMEDWRSMYLCVLQLPARGIGVSLERAPPSEVDGAPLSPNCPALPRVPRTPHPLKIN